MKKYNKSDKITIIINSLKVHRMSLPYQQKMIPRARELRKNMTKPEKHLWYDFLREYPIRFQRQKTIRSFIADFYCHKARLIIELDGSQHYTLQGEAYDKERTGLLEEFGLEVIRFSNLDVDTNFEGVCAEIDKIVKSRVEEK